MFHERSSSAEAIRAKYRPARRPAREPNPLVSIIVRTKDRPELLARAVQSVAKQTYKPLEVLIVNDGGCGLAVDDLRELLHPSDLVYLNLAENAGRAHAANVGLQHASGTWIGFLDDDDEYYPEHIETLTAFSQQANAPAVYGAVEFIDRRSENANGPHVQHVFGKQFCLSELLNANYIPLISLLIQADLLKRVGFDESFELYEDWDMLIRLAEHVPPTFVDRITSIYSQWGGSQIAFNSSEEFIRRWTLSLYAKHWDKMVAHAQPSTELIAEMKSVHAQTSPTMRRPSNAGQTTRPSGTAGGGRSSPMLRRLLGQIVRRRPFSNRQR